MQQRQPVLVEGPEPVVPGDLLERLSAGVAGEVEADHADIVITAGSANARRTRASLFRPSPYFIVIGYCCGFRS
ncbi:MAG: hypothetical protein ROO76_11215 [Terriglobia bacterium]|nr:hypothetical protein [Terriglobia bacterium]